MGDGPGGGESERPADAERSSDRQQHEQDAARCSAPGEGQKLKHREDRSDRPQRHDLKPANIGIGRCVYPDSREENGAEPEREAGEVEAVAKGAKNGEPDRRQERHRKDPDDESTSPEKPFELLAE